MIIQLYYYRFYLYNHYWSIAIFRVKKTQGAFLTIPTYLLAPKRSDSNAPAQYGLVITGNAK
jgi:hypothetical protein